MAKSVKFTLPAPRSQAKPPKVPTPRTRDEAALLVSRVGALAAARAHIEAKVARAVNDALLHLVEGAGPLEAEIAASLKSLRKWADAHRDVLLEGGAKTVELATGALYWRFGAEALALADGVDEAEVITRLAAADLDAFIRVSESLDRERIKAEWDALADQVDGLARVQREFFYVHPKALPEPIEVKTAAERVVAVSQAKRRARSA